MRQFGSKTRQIGTELKIRNLWEFEDLY